MVYYINVYMMCRNTISNNLWLFQTWYLLSIFGVVSIYMQGCCPVVIIVCVAVRVWLSANPSMTQWCFLPSPTSACQLVHAPFPPFMCYHMGISPVYLWPCSMSLSPCDLTTVSSSVCACSWPLIMSHLDELCNVLWRLTRGHAGLFVLADLWVVPGWVTLKQYFVYYYFWCVIVMKTWLCFVLKGPFVEH